MRNRFDDQASLQSSSGVLMMLIMMMMSTKALLVAQWIGLLSARTPVNSHLQALVLQVHLNLPEIATLTMRRHEGAGAHSSLEQTG